MADETYFSGRQRLSSPGFVYVLRGPSGLFKIGASKQPKERIQSLLAGHPPENFEVVALIQTRSMLLEKQLHERYTHKRMGGEWFALSDSDVAEIKAMPSDLTAYPPLELEDSFAWRVRKLREIAGLGQQDLAAKSGLSLGLVSQIEQGRLRNPRLSTLLALADAFSVRVAKLIPGTTWD